MFQKIRHAYELGKRYSQATQDKDLAVTMGSLDGSMTYRDYLAKHKVLREAEVAISKFNLLEKTIFNCGQHLGIKDLPKWKESGRQRQQELRKMIVPELYLAINHWFSTKASPRFNEGQEDSEGEYGGYIKDWSIGLTADGILEARLDYGRVDDKVAAENDFLAIFAERGFMHVTPKDFLDGNHKSLYYFKK